MQFRIAIADYADPADAGSIVRLLDAYARDPWGSAAGLPPPVLDRVVAGLHAQAGAFSVLAWTQPAEEPPLAVGLVNCLPGYSTFAARPTVNIHDVFVAPGWRGHGLAGRLLAAVEAQARAQGCCKITLEVLTGNLAAQASYRRAGFGDPPGSAAVVNPPGRGHHLFWHKPLG